MHTCSFLVAGFALNCEILVSPKKSIAYFIVSIYTYPWENDMRCFCSILEMKKGLEF